MSKNDKQQSRYDTDSESGGPSCSHPYPSDFPPPYAPDSPSNSKDPNIPYVDPAKSGSGQVHPAGGPVPFPSAIHVQNAAQGSSAAQQPPPGQPRIAFPDPYAQQGNAGYAPPARPPPQGNGPYGPPGHPPPQQQQQQLQQFTQPHVPPTNNNIVYTQPHFATPMPAPHAGASPYVQVQGQLLVPGAAGVTQYGTAATTVIISSPSQRAYLGPNPTTALCPRCNRVVQTMTIPVTGLITYCMSGAILLAGCWLGCCLIPFSMNSMRDVAHRCPQCGYGLGVYRRL
ncbi:LITAF-like zinc ribbon domain-containing protein [Fimicolochytrium jonesii]|uniref:LITAF-like zinc ribbon domain-containing protein n=1 Tax=Fimicolochytrium jonesii TaxID=1396493 RepID=UPI0022FF12CC|nr:LITAF-like zinc ribbon domain-containing protein [Fimicolochytrium jonesii]KAI8823099.1 LITAF-like zinc ribbon domain-containing protein [Fimicolochytrium jonesii]